MKTNEALNKLNNTYWNCEGSPFKRIINFSTKDAIDKQVVKERNKKRDLYDYTHYFKSFHDAWNECSEYVTIEELHEYAFTVNDLNKKKL